MIQTKHFVWVWSSLGKAAGMTPFSTSHSFVSFFDFSLIFCGEKKRLFMNLCCCLGVILPWMSCRFWTAFLLLWLLSLVP
jgi:hypothetical protein